MGVWPYNTSVAVDKSTKPLDGEIMEVLKGNAETKAAGTFVLEGQGTASAEGFKNVSQYWYPKTEPVEKAIEAIRKEQEGREDLMVKVGSIKPEVKDGSLVVVIGDGRSLKLDQHAINQLAMKLEVPTTLTNHYLSPKMHPTKDNVVKYERDEQDFRIVRDALINGLRRRDQTDDMLFRIYGKEQCRAVLSDRYSIVDNVWYLEILHKLLPGARVSHWRGNADTIFGNILIPDTVRAEDDSDYGGMISLSNCEIGKRVISQTPSIFRAICMNGCIWGATKGYELRKRHKGIDLDDLADRIKENINAQIPLLTSGVDLILVTKSWKAETKMFNLFTQLAYDTKCNAAEITGIAQEWVEQGKNATAFGMIDAVTRYGQKTAPERWVGLDVAAGKLLTRKNWDTLNAKAKALTQDEVAKAFAVMA